MVRPKKQRSYCDYTLKKTLSESRVHTLAADLSDGNVYLAGYDTSKLISYDSTGNTRRWEVSTPTPQGVFANNGYIYVNSVSERKVSVYGKDGSYHNEFFYGDITQHYPCLDLAGIVSSSDRSILFLLSNRARIYYLTANRDSISFVNELRPRGMGSKHNGMGAIPDPLWPRLVVSRDDVYEMVKISATDHDDNSVMSLFGREYFSYQPLGVHVNEFGYVFVASDRKVVLFGPGDDFFCRFPSSDLQYQINGVTIGTDATVWVSSWKDNKIYLLG